jgi:hypothetical protein
MDLERVAGRSCEFYPHGLVKVFYGGAESVERSSLVGTDALYTCVGVVLLDEDVVSLAHFPVEGRFKIIGNGVQFIGKENRTFGELAELLFSKHGPVTEQTSAVMAGGVEGESGELLRRLEDELRRRGVNNISQRGPHSQKVEWDLRIRKGEVAVSAHRRHSY